MLRILRSFEYQLAKLRSFEVRMSKVKNSNLRGTTKMKTAARSAARNFTRSHIFLFKPVYEKTQPWHESGEGESYDPQSAIRAVGTNQRMRVRQAGLHTSTVNVYPGGLSHFSLFFRRSAPD